MTNYLSSIKQSLYPQWQYTGGYITVSEGQGSTIVLRGYADPDWEESQILIKKVESIAGVKPYWQRIGASEPPTLLSEIHNLALEATTVEETTEEAEQAIQGLVNFVNTIQSGIHTKAVEDLKSVFGLFDSARKATEINWQNLIKSSQDRDKQAREWLNQAISQNLTQQASNLQRTLSSYSQIWKDRMVDTIKSIDLQKAKDVVKRMQEQFPNESPLQISTRLMNEKSIYAIVLAATVSIFPGLPVVIEVIDFLPISKLLAEMIYQISVAYGFDKSPESETDLEILSISLLVNGSQLLVKKGLDFMTSQIPAYGVAISASTTLIMFQVTGYAACEFYEAKSKKSEDSLTGPETFDLLEQKVEVYTEKLISVEKTLAETAAQAIAMKEQLAPA